MQTVSDMLTSRKFLAAVAASIIYGIGRFVFHLDADALDRLVELAMVYIGAQGIADHGKPAAQIAGAAAVKVAEINAAGAATVAAVETAAVTAPASPIGGGGGGRGLGVVALLVLGLSAGGAALPACGGTTNSRAATISSLQTGVQTASASLRAYEREHANLIIDTAPDRATGKVQLEAFRSQVDKAWRAVDAARATVDAANTINDDTSLAGARRALADAITAIADLTSRGTSP